MLEVPSTLSVLKVTLTFLFFYFEILFPQFIFWKIIEILYFRDVMTTIFLSICLMGADLFS